MTEPRNQLHRIALAWLVCLLLSPTVLALDFPKNIGEIKLRNVMWQVLPDEVYAVFVGPKDRVWYQLCHPTSKEDLAVVRRIIKREFSKNAPQLFGARPALFEPKGRVWFITHSKTVLLGYDGKEMLERKADNKHYFLGNCPNHGRVTRKGWNLFADDTAFFIESHGILTFSKGKWGYQQMTRTPSSKRAGTRTYPTLYLEQDGKGVTAFMSERQISSLWRWRNGTWRRETWPDDLDLKTLSAVAPWQNGVWLFTKNGISYHGYEGNKAEEFQRLLPKIGHRSYKVRKKATGEMIKLGGSILAYAEGALKKTGDPEVQVRLKEVINTLTAIDPQTMSFGPYTLERAELVFYDVDATIYVTAENITQGNESLGSGVVIARKDGTMTAVTGNDIPKRWGSNQGEDSGPLVLEPGKRIWLPNRSDRSGSGSGLLDMKQKAFTLSIPQPQVHWLHAVKSDGTVFAGRRESTQPWGRPLMVYKPSAADDRNFLESESIEISKFCVATDGRVWAEAVNRGLVVYDGRKWRKVDVPGMRNIQYFLPGKDGSLIIKGADSSALVTGDKIIQNGSLKDLIADNAKEIAELFKDGSAAPWLGVASDNQGNIWLRETRKLSVLVNGEWLDASDALKNAGSRLGEVEYLGVCGNGAKVYITDFMLYHDKGSSHFGEVKNGQVVFSKAPHNCERYFMHLNIRDDEGALWVPGSIQRASATCDIITGQLALRITEKGVAQELKNAGWAKLKDQNGNIWLGEIRRQDKTLFNIWRKGKITNTVKVPGASEKCILVSDKPGSVFILTKLGLYHMVTKNPGKPGEYSLENLYYIKGIGGSDRAVVKLSKLGFLAVSIYSYRHRRNRCDLFIVRLPD